MIPDYNNIAWIYDWLAKIVFGRKLELAKQAYLAQIPKNANVLVVGGGTGKILDYLRDLDKQLKVDFIEQSEAMILRAKKRKTTGLRLNFYNHSILDLKTTDYDVVLTNFFFDQFSKDQAYLVLQHLKPKLRRNGILVFSDFISTNHWWDKLIVRLMYFFFQLTVNMQANALPPYNYLFSSHNYYPISSKKIGRNIIATVYSLD